MAEKIVLDDIRVAIGGRGQPQPVLRGVSASIADGEMVALAGRSGSGKTTLLNVIGGLEPAFSGTVSFDGEPVWKASDAEGAKVRAQRIGFVFQESNLIAGLSAEENLLLPLLIAPSLPSPPSTPSAPSPPDTPRDRARQLLARIGLQEKAHTRAERLSGGERQRVATARALVTRPEIVLVDEPTGHLDDETGRRIIEVLLEYRTQRGATMLVATHDQRLMEHADRILRLQDGCLHERG